MLLLLSLLFNNGLVSSSVSRFMDHISRKLCCCLNMLLFVTLSGVAPHWVFFSTSLEEIKTDFHVFDYFHFSKYWKLNNCPVFVLCPVPSLPKWAQKFCRAKVLCIIIIIVIIIVYFFQIFAFFGWHCSIQSPVSGYSTDQQLVAEMRKNNFARRGSEKEDR